MSPSYEGFVVHSYARSRKGRTALYLLGRLSDGSTFAIVENRYQPNFYVREGDAAATEQTIASTAVNQFSAVGDVHLVQSSLSTMDGEPCRQVICATQEIKRKLRDALQQLGTRTYEADLRVADQFRLERRIHGPIRIRGEANTGRYVKRVFVDPEVEAGTWQPRLSVLSIDIETEVRTQVVRAVALSLQDPFRDSPAEEDGVLFLGPELHRPGVECFSDEKMMLRAFRERLAALDPDVITGWNVIDFDLQVLSDRFRHHGLPFTIGRSREAAVYLPQSESRGGRTGSRAIVPGRQVWDGVRIVRASPDAFEDYSLETVAGAILGYGKRIEVAEGEDRIQAIDRLYREQPEELCAYCLEDARLVHRIMARTGLFELTLRRCILIGVAPDLAWTSIAAFEHLYTEALYQRGMAAPTFGVDLLPMEGAPGGIILAPRPGLFDDVMVFDFQSLYPSIIRTFNIDPLSYAGQRREPHGETPEQQPPIRAPNGALFSRQPGILPELLDRFFERRAQAQEEGDAVASFVYKIIMNSFYGVLGARGCRFAGSDLAGAITSFGQRILGWCKDFLEDLGYTVLYGDTDSLFVTVLGGTASPSLSLDGLEICRQVNRALEEYLVESYGVEPRLTLRFEKRYSRFFLPPLRSGGGEKGRAKGYAGLLAVSEGEDAADLQGRIEVRGMEAVRRDWTDLAHDFQLRLLELLFLKRPLEEIKGYIRELVEALYRGELDDKLVYRKALRKSISAYTRNTPPHVKAASLLPRSEQRGLIRYLITVEGPQPQARTSARIDYDHYLDRQLLPIASAFTEALKTDLEALFGRGGQLWLF